MAKTMEIKDVYWDDEKKLWISENKTPLTPKQLRQILDHYELFALSEYFPADVLIKTSPEELLAEKEQSQVFSKMGADDDDTVRTYIWDRRKKTWIMYVDLDEKTSLPQPSSLSQDDLEEILLQTRASNLYHYLLENPNKGEKLLEKALHVPPEKLPDYQFFFFDNIDWDEKENCWFSKDNKPLTPEQLKQILYFYELHVMAEYFPAEILLKTSPKELIAEQNQAAIVQFITAADPTCFNLVFWDRRKNTWMVDTYPRDALEHQPNPKPLSKELLFDFFLHQELHALKYKSKINEELIIHLPLNELKKLK